MTGRVRPTAAAACPCPRRRAAPRSPAAPGPPPGTPRRPGPTRPASSFAFRAWCAFRGQLAHRPLDFAHPPRVGPGRLAACNGTGRGRQRQARVRAAVDAEGEKPVAQGRVGAALLMGGDREGQLLPAPVIRPCARRRRRAAYRRLGWRRWPAPPWRGCSCGRRSRRRGTSPCSLLTRARKARIRIRQKKKCHDTVTSMPALCRGPPGRATR